MRVATALLLLVLPGCSTIADTFRYDEPPPVLKQPGPNIFGGVRTDYAHMGDTSCAAMMKPIFFLDFPFSFALDLVLLPFTVPYNLLRPGPPTVKELEDNK